MKILNIVVNGKKHRVVCADIFKSDGEIKAELVVDMKKPKNNDRFSLPLDKKKDNYIAVGICSDIVNFNVTYFDADELNETWVKITIIAEGRWVPKKVKMLFKQLSK